MGEKRKFLTAASLLPALLFSGPVFAHPHVWVTAKEQILFGPGGKIVGFRHTWTFDEMYSAFATQGLGKDGKPPTREELAPLAQTNVENLKEFGFFTFARAGENGSRKKQKFEEPVDYYLEHKNGALTLHFTLPLKTPVKSKELAVEIFDPTYFVDFSLAKADPIRLIGAPAGCKLGIVRPSDGAVQAKTLGEQNFLDGSNANYGAMFANKVTVDCP